MKWKMQVKCSSEPDLKSWPKHSEWVTCSYFTHLLLCKLPFFFPCSIWYDRCLSLLQNRKLNHETAFLHNFGFSGSVFSLCLSYLQYFIAWYHFTVNSVHWENLKWIWVWEQCLKWMTTCNKSFLLSITEKGAPSASSHV